MPLGANKAAIMGVAGVSTGDVVLLSSQTASDDASLTFNSGITSTYGEYIFRFYNIHAESDDQAFSFQANAVGASGYNETMTTTWLQAYHAEGDAEATLRYVTGSDQAQGTAYHSLSPSLGTDNDQNAAGELHIFNPASSALVKYFYSRSMVNGASENQQDIHTAGYFNTTTAIDDINFKMASGNLNGTVKLWGVK